MTNTEMKIIEVVEEVGTNEFIKLVKHLGFKPNNIKTVKEKLEKKIREAQRRTKIVIPQSLIEHNRKFGYK